MPLRACLANARPKPIERTLGPLCVGPGLVADGPELGHALLEHRVGDVGDAVLDRVVKPLELGVRFGRALAQFGDVRRSALGAVLPAIDPPGSTQPGHFRSPAGSAFLGNIDLCLRGRRIARWGDGRIVAAPKILLGSPKSLRYPGGRNSDRYIERPLAAHFA